MGSKNELIERIVDHHENHEHSGFIQLYGVIRDLLQLLSEEQIREYIEQEYIN